MASEKNLHSLSHTIEDKDLFKAVLDTRNFEISLFWQRSNYFLALNSALAVGFFARELSQFTLLLASLGVLTSIIWYLVNLGSKYWQSRWEDKLAEIEKHVAPELRAFAATKDELDKAVARSLSTNPHRLLAAQVGWKPSVTFQMTFLSLVFVVAWLIVGVVAISHGAWKAPIFPSASQPASGSTSTVSTANLACATPPQPSLTVPVPTLSANPTINIQVSQPNPRPLPPRVVPPIKEKKAPECN